MVKKIIAVIKIIRPVNILIVLLSVIISSVICASTGYSIRIIIFASLSAGFAAAAGNTINDIFDIEIDKLNRPDRPLPSNVISRKQALIMYFLFIIISLFLGYLINDAAFIVACSANMILFLYSYKFKSIPLFGNSIVASLTGLAFLYGGIAVNNVRFAVIPAVFAFLINAIREIVKDMEDVKGDSANNIKTFPILKGYKSANNLILILGIILIAATFFPFITRLYKIEYFIIIMLSVNPLIVYSIKKLFDDHSPESLNTVSRLLKLNMILGLTAIYLGK